MSAERLVSILIPLYNEEETIALLIDRVLSAPVPNNARCEVVVVDDGSTDASANIVSEIAASQSAHVRLIRHPKNRGKGAAIQTAIQNATGEFGLIQDADLEYDPSDYLRLLQPLVDGKADAVFGSRFAAAGERRVLYFWHALANKALTTLCNMFADLNLTDMETCYKAFRLSLVKSIPLRSSRFGIEPELTIKLAQRHASIYEVPVSYHGRTYAEGKKPGLKDALQAFLVILHYGFSRDIYTDNGARILDSLARTPKFNEWMASVVGEHLGSKVLELGAGIGNLSTYLSRGRKLYIASDIDQEHLARLKTRFQLRPAFRFAHCDAEKSDQFRPMFQEVDSVVCINVLEHVKDDLQSLRNIYEVLQPGGRAVILVPEGMSLYGSLDSVLGHHRRYSEGNLRSRMEQAGFEVQKIIRFNRVTRPAWFVTGRILRKQTFSRFQLWLFDHSIWFWRRVDGLIPWKPLSLIAIGVKR